MTSARERFHLHIQTDHMTVCSLDSSAVLLTRTVQAKGVGSQQPIYNTVEGYGTAMCVCSEPSSSILQEGAG